MAEILNDEQADAAVTKLSGWTREGITIERTAKLPSFPKAIEAVDKVASWRRRPTTIPTSTSAGGR